MSWKWIQVRFHIKMQRKLFWPHSSFEDLALTVCTQTESCDTRSGDLVFYSAALTNFMCFWKSNFMILFTGLDFKYNYSKTIHLIRGPVVFYFMSESPNLARMQTHHLSILRLFADDCVCYREIKDEKDTMKLQKDIDRLGSWARKWGMRFQPHTTIWCSWQENGSRRSMLHIPWRELTLKTLKALNTLE